MIASVARTATAPHASESLQQPRGVAPDRWNLLPVIGRSGLYRQRSAYNHALMVKQLEMIEGEQAYGRFRDGMKAVLAVPRAVVQKRIEEQRAISAKNPSRRGPKRKT
jgi:hypothetical protein